MSCLLIDAEELVEQPLDGAEDRRQQRALALEDAGHVGAHRLGDEQQGDDVDQDLNDTVRGHHGPPVLKPLRFQQREQQVAEEEYGHQTCPDVVDHGISPLKSVAGAGIDRGDDKK